MLGAGNSRFRGHFLYVEGVMQAAEMQPVGTTLSRR
jgi:hypothetical protein